MSRKTLTVVAVAVAAAITAILFAVYLSCANRSPTLSQAAICGIAVTWGVAAVYLGRTRPKSRGLAELAGKLGLEYHPGGKGSLDVRFSYFDFFKHHHSCGHSHRCYNLTSGLRNGVDVMLFDYSYDTSMQRHHPHRTTMRYFTVCVLKVAAKGKFPHVVFGPEKLHHKIASLAGLDDIDFESAGFSRKFIVRSRDRRFAYDLLHPRAIELLLEAGPICGEAAFRAVLLHYNRRLDREGWEKLAQVGIGFAELVPRHLRDYQAGGDKRIEPADTKPQ